MICAQHAPIGEKKQTKTQGIGRHVVRHNICIPNAQYYEFSAQQNPRCEILEF